jgi:hypothetical protein
MEQLTLQRLNQQLKSRHLMAFFLCITRVVASI